MLKQVTSAKMLIIFTLTAVMLSAVLVWCLRPTKALTLESSTGTGLITVNAGQTARLIVMPGSEGKVCYMSHAHLRASGYAFQVYRPSDQNRKAKFSISKLGTNISLDELETSLTLNTAHPITMKR